MGGGGMYLLSCWRESFVKYKTKKRTQKKYLILRKVKEKNKQTHRHATFTHTKEQYSK